MPLLRDDYRLLHRALDLAKATAAFASPNPAVGCVLTRGNEVLGEGAHRYDFRDHAEIAALKQAAALGHDVHGATAYVTLEPCSHHGRTGPCADVLAAAGIARCVIATVDPNPEVRGGGIRKLTAANIDVEIADPAAGIAQAARRLNDAFAFSIQHGRPFVTLKAAVSADGKLAPDPTARTAQAPHWITGPAARADVQQLRHASDAILTGIGTVLADNPALTDRTGLPRRRPLLRIVLDSQLRTHVDSALVRSAKNNLLLIAAAATDPLRAQSLAQRGVEVVQLPDISHDSPLNHTEALKIILRDVLPPRGIRGVLAEGGSTLNGALLAADLADKVILYRGPDPLGPKAIPFAHSLDQDQVQPPFGAWLRRLTDLSEATFPHGDREDVRYSGYLHDPWTTIDSSPLDRT